MSEFQPKIIAFLCNWCAYGGADQAGGSKLTYSANVTPIRVMCSGRVDPQLVMQAYQKGADAVMVLGCHPGDCHYRDGNLKARRRFTLFQKMLRQFGIHEDRFLLDWVAASEGKKFQRLANEITERIKVLGPLELKGWVDEGAA